MRAPLLSLFTMLCLVATSCDKENDSPDNDPPTSPSTLQEGLLLYMPFSGNLGDSSGNALQASPFGSIGYGANRYFEANKSVVFNGSDNRIEVSSPKLENLNSFTFYMEFLPATINSMTLLSRSKFAEAQLMNQAFGLMINYQAGTRFSIKKAGNCDNHTNTSWGNLVLGQAIPSINSWNYVAVTYDGTTINTYLNGVRVATSI